MSDILEASTESLADLKVWATNDKLRRAIQNVLDAPSNSSQGFTASV